MKYRAAIKLSGFTPIYDMTIELPEKGYDSDLTYFLEGGYKSIHIHVLKSAYSDRIEKRKQAIKKRLIQVGYTETLQGDSAISFHDTEQYNYPFNIEIRKKRKSGFKQSLKRMIERF